MGEPETYKFSSYGTTVCTHNGNYGSEVILQRRGQEFREWLRWVVGRKDRQGNWQHFSSSFQFLSKPAALQPLGSWDTSVSSELRVLFSFCEKAFWGHRLRQLIYLDLNSSSSDSEQSYLTPRKRSFCICKMEVVTSTLRSSCENLSNGSSRITTLSRFLINNSYYF